MQYLMVVCNVQYLIVVVFEVTGNLSTVDCVFLRKFFVVGAIAVKGP